MALNPGPVIPCMSGAITAAITHSKRVNGDNDTEDNLVTYTKSEPKEYKPISSTKEILEELKKVLEQEKCKDKDSISIYNLMKLMRKKYEEWLSIENNLNYYMERKINTDIFFFHLDFDCENKNLIIRYHGDEAFFTKKDGDLIISKSAWCDAKDALGKCGDEISKCYDKFIEDISFHRDYMKNIKSSNSNFIINTSEYGIYLSERKYGLSEFELCAKIYDDKYEYNCNSNNVTSVCRNNEDELFKRVFVKIEDCPEWVRATLCKNRQQQLLEERKLEEKEMKKQKRLELVRKIFPFIKK